MSRGGRGGGRGGRKGGPDMSWQDDDQETTGPLRRVPGPIFPERHIPVPKPMDGTEKTQIKCLLDLRERMRTGPLYTVLDPSQLLDSKGKVNHRAGFDPFNDQERFTRRYHRKKRTIPDHTERPGYSLRLFPVELWPILDPRKKQKEYWDSLSDEVKARLDGNRGVKRKRELKFNDIEEEVKKISSEAEAESDEDIVDGGRRPKVKTQSSTQTKGKGKQKKGLDAEDDYPEVEQDEDGEGVMAEDEPQDSEFGSDEEDDAYDDYNAENYFDDGAEDDMADGGDDDGGGGAGGGGDYY